MNTVSIQDLEVGAVLARPICDEAGRILVDEGCPIGPSLIDRLERWGVRAVDVYNTVPRLGSSQGARSPGHYRQCSNLAHPQVQLIRNAMDIWSRTRQIQINGTTSPGTS